MCVVMVLTASSVGWRRHICNGGTAKIISFFRKTVRIVSDKKSIDTRPERNYRKARSQNNRKGHSLLETRPPKEKLENSACVASCWRFPF